MKIMNRQFCNFSIKQIFSIFRFEGWTKSDIFGLYCIYILISIVTLSMYSCTKLEPASIDQKRLVGKIIEINSPFTIKFRGASHRVSSFLRITKENENILYISSCIGLKEKDNINICKKNDRNYTISFEKDHQLSFFIRKVSKNRFDGLLLSIKNTKTREYLFKNQSKKEYLIRIYLIDYTILIFLIFIFLHIFFATKKLLSFSSKK